MPALTKESRFSRKDQTRDWVRLKTTIHNYIPGPPRGAAQYRFMSISASLFCRPLPPYRDERDSSDDGITPSSRFQQPGQPGEVVGGKRQREIKAHARQSAKARLALSGYRCGARRLMRFKRGGDAR